MAWDEGTRLQILAPVVRGRKGEYRKDIQQWQKQGYSRINVDGKTYDIDDTPTLDKNVKHDIEVIIDRLAIKESNKVRLADSIETALKLTDGLVMVEPVTKKDEDKDLPKAAIFSEKHSCHLCDFAMPPLEPRLFSFNSPHGACAACDGLGEMIFFDPNLIVPDHEISIMDGAIKPWAKHLLAIMQKLYHIIINLI